MNKTVNLFMAILMLLLPASLLAECRKDLPFHKANRFVDNQDGTVTDTLTNLMWMRCPLGRIWDPVKSFCEIPFEHIEGVGSKKTDVQDTWNRVHVETSDFNTNGGFAGATDWRVPNIKELASISMLHCYPPIDTKIFPDAASSEGATMLWSSTPSRKYANVLVNDDTQNPQYAYESQAWAFSFVDTRNAGKAVEEVTSGKHHVLLVRSESKQASKR